MTAMDKSLKAHNGHHEVEAPPISRYVLVVDDDPDYLALVRMQLESAGHEVTCASSPKEAEELIKQRQPDIAVVDLMMDHPDAGFTLCYHIKKKHPKIPVIMMSIAHGETGMDFDATTPEEKRWVKADVFLEKPLRIEQLTHEMERLLGG
jgi:CheY-like chemotaxis protein